MYFARPRLGKLHGGSWVPAHRSTRRTARRTAIMTSAISAKEKSGELHQWGRGEPHEVRVGNLHAHVALMTGGHDDIRAYSTNSVGPTCRRRSSRSSPSRLAARAAEGRAEGSLRVGEPTAGRRVTAAAGAADAAAVVAMAAVGVAAMAAVGVAAAGSAFSLCPRKMPMLILDT